MLKDWQINKINILTKNVMQQDDTHTCKRCMIEIVGLENYVTHRQQNCQTKATYHSSQPPACEPPNDIGYNTCNNDIDLQNASDFFSSLELKCNVSDSYNVSTKKLSTDLFPMTFEYDSDNYAETENGYYPPQSHTGGKWEPGTRPDLTNEHWLRSPSPTRKDYECTLCKKIYQDKTSLDKHLNSLVHQIVKVPEQEIVTQTEKESYIDSKFPCKTCHLGFEHETKYLTHILAEDHKEKCSNLTSWHKLVLKQQIKANRLFPYHCTICQFVFSQNNDLLNHMKEANHQEKFTELRRNLYCLNCRYEAFNNEDLIKHVASKLHFNTIKNANEFHPVMIIEKSLRFACKYCLGYCKLLTESKTATKSCKEIILYNCPYCKFNSKSSSLLRCHLCREHPGNSRKDRVIQLVIDKSKEESKTIDLVCSVCKEPARNASELRQHIISKHSEESVNCKTCNRLYMSEDDFQKHCKSKMHKMRSEKAPIAEINLEFELELPRQIFQCHKCHFKSESRGLMCLHCAQHDGPIPDVRFDENGLKIIGNVYQCPFCSKEFRFSQLECHIYTHTGEKPFKCSFCKKRFSQKTTQKAHEISHSKNNKSNEYKCEVCSFRTKRKAIYNIHMKTHPDKKKPKFQGEYSKLELFQRHSKSHVENKFLCEICGFSARSKHYLSSHQRIHTGEKPYCCKTCSYKAAHYTNLVRHTRRHTGDKPFKCPYCEYSCNTQDGIRKHIARSQKHRNLAVFPCSYPTCKHTSNDYGEFKSHVIENHLDIQFAEKTESEILTFLYAHKDLLNRVSKPFLSDGISRSSTLSYQNSPTESIFTKASLVSNQNNPIISTSLPKVLDQKRIITSLPTPQTSNQNGVVLVQHPFQYTTVNPLFVSSSQPNLFIVQNNSQAYPRILPATMQPMTVTTSLTSPNCTQINPNRPIQYGPKAATSVIQPLVPKLATLGPKIIESAPPSFVVQNNIEQNSNQFFYTFNGQTVIPNFQQTPRVANVVLRPNEQSEVIYLTGTKESENTTSSVTHSNSKSSISLEKNSTEPRKQTIIIRKITQVKNTSMGNKARGGVHKNSIQIIIKQIPQEINNVEKIQEKMELKTKLPQIKTLETVELE